MRCAIPSFRASRATATASCFDSLRKPWSMVTATRSGFAFNASRQRAASTMSAVESGPPDTANTSTGKDCRPEKSALASDAETPRASAVRTLLFLRDAALHAAGGARIFASDFRERGAGGFLLIHRR